MAAAVTFAAAFGLYRVWPDPAPDRVPRTPSPAPVTYSYVTVFGDPTGAIEDAREHQGAGCAPSIAPLIAHPNWSLQLVEGESGCTGEWVRNSYEVFADGSVLWEAEHLPARVLHLTAPELALITRTNDFPCGRTDPVGYGYDWMRIAPGGDPEGRGAASIPSSSLAGGMLGAVMQGAIERYRAARLAQIGPFELRLGVQLGRSRYKITLDGTGHLVFRRGHDELPTRILEPAERVDLFDFLATRVGAVRIPGDDSVVVRGVLISGGVSLPISMSRWEHPQLDALWATLDDARELEASE